MTILTKSSPVTNRESAAGPTWVKGGRIPCLDGLRALSILLVLLAHASQTHGFAAAPWFKALAHRGAIGVDVFFVVSGFLITLLMTREIARTGSVCLKGFYFRRLLRITPVYLLFLLTVLALTRTEFMRLEPRDWAGALTYTVNFLPEPSWEIGHLWSLSIEEQFYLLWPPLLLLAGLGRARVAVIAYLCIAPLLRLGVWAMAREHLAMVDAWTFTRCDSIAAGCLLALLAADPAWIGRLTLPRRKALGLGVGALALLILSVAARSFTLYTIALGYTINALSIAALVWVCATHGQGRLGRVLNARPLVAIGLLSYSLYLWQQIFLNPHNASFACQWPLNVILALIAAVISYRLVELPFLRLKDRGARADAAAPATSVARPSAAGPSEPHPTPSAA